MYKLWEALKEAKKYRWVELSHSLNNDSPYWAGIPEGSVELGPVCYDWGNEMLDCLIQTFKFPGQFGTHIDFPGHFVKDRELSENYGVKDLIFPLCVIDVTEKVKKNPTYVVTSADIKDLAVGSGMALFVDIFQRIHGPAGEIFSAFGIRPGEGVHIRPFFRPVGSEDASVMCWTAENCRWRYSPTWIRWLLQARSSSYPIRL